MVNLQITVDVFDQTVIDRKLDALEDELAEVVERAARKLELHAKLNAPVDTGFLRNSIQVVLFGAVAQVGGDGSATLDGPASRLEAEVVVGAEYGLYVEYGHYVERSNERKFDTAGRGVGYGKKTVRRAASRIIDRRVGTYVQGVFYMSRAMQEVEPYFRAGVASAIAKAAETK